MNEKRIIDALENSVISAIQKGDVFKFGYDSRIDLSDQLKEAYKKIDYNKVMANITRLLEEEIARKVVDKVVTEMGTDIKKLMENATVREDFRFMLRTGTEKILKQIKGNE
jgi:hypothetical protein